MIALWQNDDGTITTLAAARPPSVLEQMRVDRHALRSRLHQLAKGCAPTTTSTALTLTQADGHGHGYAPVSGTVYIAPLLTSEAAHEVCVGGFVPALLLLH